MFIKRGLAGLIMVHADTLMLSGRLKKNEAHLFVLVCRDPEANVK